MKRLTLVCVVAASLLLYGAQAQQQAPPPFDPASPGAHDPVMAKEGDTYYVFATGRGVSRLASKDLKTWEVLPPVFA
ncbi:MAG: hypothetical protein LBQ65_08495 [Tannerellaceae bacterium]|jgi:arabinan endo-1,5-alpha-L-arabinosidase|nr:hypothetical protein [Tannerellaceae bacterium]